VPPVTDASVRVRVNGKDEALPAAPITVSEFLASKGVRPETVAVELNLTVIAKADYPKVRLKEGDEIEIVRFVGGGAF
jgi:thiamine biosynthesis protein ThiS